MRRSDASVQSDEEWCLCAIGEVRSSGVMKCGDVWRCLVKWDSDLKYNGSVGFLLFESYRYLY